MAYASQLVSARKRGIEWLFTFESWWQMWQPLWHRRGKRAHELCMARFGDAGPYSPTNVRITTNRENHEERERRKRSTQP